MPDFLPVLAGGMRSPSDADGRQYGAISGRVVDVSDPDGLARVRVRLKGMDSGDSTDWVSPMLPGGIESIPALDDAVVVFPVDGDFNRGLYTCHPQSRTRNRPTEAIPLGTTFARLYNHVVTLINELRADHNTLNGQYIAHQHVETGGTTNAPSPPNNTGAEVTTGAAGSAKAADGSTPASLASDSIALSGVAKVK